MDLLMDRSTNANTTQPNPGGVWHPQNAYSRTVSRQHPLPHVLHYLLPSHLLVLFKRLPLLLHGYNLKKQALHCARCAPDITACPYKLNEGGAPGYHSLHTDFLRASCSQFDKMVNSQTMPAYADAPSLDSEANKQVSVMLKLICSGMSCSRQTSSVSKGSGSHSCSGMQCLVLCTKYSKAACRQTAK